MKLEEALPNVRKGFKLRFGHFGVDSSITYSKEDILSDNWIIEPIKKVVSREDLSSACVKADMELAKSNRFGMNSFLEIVYRELGL